MKSRLSARLPFPSMLLICLFFPGAGLAQTPPPVPDDAPLPLVAAQKHHHDVPKPPPTWGYYGLDGGPGLTTDYPFKGWPGYRGAYGTIFSNGPLLSHTPVPVYTPVPAVFTDGPVHPLNSRKRIGLGLVYFGWRGPYSASPRPSPTTVNVWSPVDPRGLPKHDRHAAKALPAGAPGCLTLAVTVPGPDAEVFVEGVKTAQRGTERVFESPALEEGKEFRYELVARWVEQGETVERKRVVSGKPGEVVAVDFRTER